MYSCALEADLLFKIILKVLAFRCVLKIVLWSSFKMKIPISELILTEQEFLKFQPRDLRGGGKFKH